MLFLVVEDSLLAQCERFVLGGFSSQEKERDCVIESAGFTVKEREEEKEKDCRIVALEFW